MLLCMIIDGLVGAVTNSGDFCSDLCETKKKLADVNMTMVTVTMCYYDDGYCDDV